MPMCMGVSVYLLVPAEYVSRPCTSNYVDGNVSTTPSFGDIVPGLFQAPYSASPKTLMAEPSTPGFDNMFFCSFGLSNYASSVIDPNIVQAIINKSGNNWDGVPFSFALCPVASLVIRSTVDVQEGRWAAERRGVASATASHGVDGESFGISRKT
ncbi:hypothetical protein H4582DRAFT_2123978 [Lactarius indigo]|nr:hypothetical protein H4582DRAFT_2123978 [Lactarius indigo]